MDGDIIQWERQLSHYCVIFITVFLSQDGLGNSVSWGKDGDQRSRLLENLIDKTE